MSYQSHADLGGRPVGGAIVAEPEGEIFHAPWESRVLALTLAMGASGQWNIDISRAARETLPEYHQLSYYEIWFAALQHLLQQRGLVQRDELAVGQALHPIAVRPRVLAAAEVAPALASGAPTGRPATAPAKFAPGTTVRTRAAAVPHHTRLPAYARGKVGRVERAHGMHVYADTHAQGLGEQPQWLYTVVFDGATLWGDSSSADLTVSIDAWEPYLEAA